MFLKVPVIIIIKFDEINMLGTIYIYILILGVVEGGTWFTLHFLVYYS